MWLRMAQQQLAIIFGILFSFFLNANSPHQELIIQQLVHVSRDGCQSWLMFPWISHWCILIMLWMFVQLYEDNKVSCFQLASLANQPATVNKRNDMLWEHSKQLERGVVWDYDTEDFTGFDLHWPEFFFTASSALSKRKIAAASGEVLGFFCRPKRSRNSWSGVFFNYYFF